jgi:hypothetical protein
MSLNLDKVGYINKKKHTFTTCTRVLKIFFYRLTYVIINIIIIVNINIYHRDGLLLVHACRRKSILLKIICKSE